MVTKRQLIETFGEEREGKTVVVCPTCPDAAFESLEQWKDHMQHEHGGYTAEEVSEGLGASSSNTSSDDASLDKGGTPMDTSRPTKPKKLSAKARELNEKVNRCISLILKHLISGITEAEQQELEQSRADVTQAFVGIEFDFEERIFSLSGRWAIIVAIILLYTVPALPSMKDALAKVRQKALEKIK